jgi:AcrR family transcriptional regulator
VPQAELAQRRGAILDAARRAFARHGYEGATVRVLEAETGLSRGAIFHHFRDKEALFLALAEDDAARTAEVVARSGLVQVMRELRDKDAGWLGVQLEVRRRLRTDPAFAASWAERQEAVALATAERLERQRRAGVVRTDVPVALLVDYLRLVLDGLVSRIASGMSIDHLDGVLDLVEDAVRTPTSVTRIDQRSTTMASQDSFGARSTLDVGDASYEVFRLRKNSYGNTNASPRPSVLRAPKLSWLAMVLLLWSMRVTLVGVRTASSTRSSTPSRWSMLMPEAIRLTSPSRTSRR